MKGYIKPCLALLIFFASCQSDAPSNAPENNLEEIMPGTWETVSFEVLVNSVDNTDSVYLFTIGEKDWGPKLGIKSLNHVFESDRNYYRVSRNLADSVLDRTRGKWFLNGDSIRLVTPVATYEYEVSIDGSKSTFHCFLDWDGDGQDDDEYTSIQRKISKYSQ